MTSPFQLMQIQLLFLSFFSSLLGEKLLSQNNESVPSCKFHQVKANYNIHMLQEIQLFLYVLVPIGFTQRKIKTSIFR